MSQLEEKHEKDLIEKEEIEKEEIEQKEDLDENRLPIGELKWSSEEEAKTSAEVSAALAALEEAMEELPIEVLSLEENDKEEHTEDPLVGLEDTLTPIDFETYNFDDHEESNLRDEYTLDEEDIEETSSSNTWLKTLLWIVSVPALLVVVLIGSLILGHTVIGGQPASDIFDLNMWQHLYNLIYS